MNGIFVLFVSFSLVLVFFICLFISVFGGAMHILFLKLVLVNVFFTDSFSIFLVTINNHLTSAHRLTP